MNIKNVNDFTLEECKKYLDTNPSGLLEKDVEKRMKFLLEKEKNTNMPESPSKEIQWINYAQFVSERYNKYIDIAAKKLFLCILLLIVCIGLNIYIYDKGIKQLIFIHALSFFIILILVFLVSYYWNICPTSATDSNKSSDILYIEKTNNEFALVQADNGKMGLVRCEEKSIWILLPCKYTKIYQCNNNLYICINEENKYGVINAQLDKMVIPIKYDKIEIESDNSLLLIKDNIKTRFAI